MTWGHFVSRDLVHWKQMTTTALRPDKSFDQAGVFTGCMVPPNDHDKSENLTVCYSSIRKLPFHWTTPPYPRNAAGIAIAASKDGGKTWTKPAEHPVLEGEPEGVAVTGFRDPYISAWPPLDQLRSQEEGKEGGLYALVSGGIQGSGPTTFLYAVSKSNLSDWEYLGPLVNLPERFCPSETWKANFGLNWECTNFMTLEEGADSRLFLIIGAEGDVERKHITQPKPPSQEHLLVRTIRQQLWMSGDLVRDAGRIEMKYRYGGILDHGSYYAANSFLDSRSGKRVVHGWIPEEDCTAEFASAKGWNGYLALPREVFLLSIPAVLTTLYTSIPDLPWVEASDNGNGLWNVLTLGVKPFEGLEKLRDQCTHCISLKDVAVLPGTEQKPLVNITTEVWELEAMISVPRSSCSMALELKQKDDPSSCVTVTFSPDNETIVVERQHSGLLKGSFNNCPEQGPFTLFVTQDPMTLIEEVEDLRLRLISDGDVLEIFANDRFALATTVYREWGSGSSVDLVPSAASPGESFVIKTLRVWDGLNGLASVIT